MSEPYRGSCLCGEIVFEIDEFLPDAAHCHCRMCRKFHGADYATYASVKADKFRWLQGTDALKIYTAKNNTQRTFCEHCGSSLVFASARADGNEVEISLGTLDSDVPISPNAHIFAGYRANWSVIDDSLDCYKEGRGS